MAFDHKEAQAVMQTICGERLTSVQFVMDYLILGFDDRGALTVLVWPELHNQDVYKFGMTGYRDRLCELIEQIVKSVDVTEDETVIVTFENGNHLRMRLREHAYPGERAIFYGPGPKHLVLLVL